MTRQLFFIMGICLIAICMLAPAPTVLADDPFCVQMIRHTVLLLLAAPLIALSIPAKNRLQKALIVLSRLTARLAFPAWIIGVGLMWVWHVPSLYNAMYMSMSGMDHGLAPMLDRMSVIHAFSMLAGGVLFCWPIITPYAEYRLPPLKAVLYLSAACVFCSLLGLLITFAPAGLYSQVSPADQQIGGLIMWVPCCLIYLSASMYLLIRWFSPQEEKPIMQPLKN